MPKVSQRGNEMPASPIRRLVKYANQAVARGVNVYRLNIGQPDVPTPPTALESLKQIDRKVLEYSPSEGLMSLRKKMCEYYKRFDININVDDIIITTGGSEAILFAFMAALDPGDEVITPEPAYANYLGFAKVAGVKVVTVPSRIEDGFQLPPVEDFEKLITPRTKGILFCNPNNPTGYLYNKAEVEKLRDIVKKHDLFLFADEVYREFCYTAEPYFSAMHLEGVEDNVVMIDSVSKRYNECGIRVGAIITKNAEIKANVLKFAQARLSPPLLGQLVAEASVDTPDEYMKQTYQEYIERRDFLINRLNQIPGCYSPMPMGAFYTVAKLPVDDAEKFCIWCLTEFDHNGNTVFMAPASGFYATPGMGMDEVRMAYVLKREDLAAAMDTLEAALEAYPGNKLKK